MYIGFLCPPMPHLIVGGASFYRKGDKHERRVIQNVFDLIYVQKGMLYMEEDGKRFDLGADRFLILPPDRVHASYKHCTEDTVFSWVHFYTEGDFTYSERPVANTATKMNKNKYYRTEQFTLSLPQLGTIAGKERARVRKLLSQISRVKIDRHNHQKLFFDSVSSQIVHQILFMRILALICGPESESGERDLAEEVYEHLVDNYASPFSLAGIAGQFSFHSTYITRCVKKKYGMTPLRLLMDIRMEKAKHLLETSDLHVNTIGRLVGYDDAAYFSKQFKKSTGATAVQYRLAGKKARHGHA